MVFEDVVFDNNKCVTLLYIVVIVTSMSNLLLSNTTSLNSRDTVYPCFDSDALFLEYCLDFGFSCLAILRTEGCLNSTL